MKSPETSAPHEAANTIHNGKVPSIQAKVGAKIEIVLAKILQIPMELAVNKVGNNIAFDKYTTLKAPEMPNLENSTKTGSTKVEGAS